MTGDGLGLRLSVVMPAEVKTTNREITAFARHVQDVGLDGIFIGDHTEREHAGPAWKEHGLVFCHEDGTPYTLDSLRYR